MNLKEKGKGYMEGFKVGERKGKFNDYIIT